jgi:hypothetical protein
MRTRILEKDRVKGAVFESLEYDGFGTNGNVMIRLEVTPEKGKACPRGRSYLIGNLAEKMATGAVC